MSMSMRGVLVLYAGCIWGVDGLAKVLFCLGCSLEKKRKGKGRDID